MVGLALLVSLVGSARAECKIGPGTATATMTTVMVGGQVYPVVGGASRSLFMSNLNECGLTGAAEEFRTWRLNRRMTNVTAIVGAVVFWPVLIATPFTALSAGDHKSAMLAALNSRPAPAPAPTPAPVATAPAVLVSDPSAVAAQ